MKRHRMEFLVAIFFFTITLSKSQTQYTWTPDPNNPVFTCGERLLEPCVLYDSTHGKFDLWFSDGFEVRRAASTDGRTWSLTGAHQSLTNLFSIHFCYSVEIVKVGSMYYLYGGCQSLDMNTMFVSLATSPDGNVWTKHPSSPVLVPGGATAWDWSYTLYPRVAVHNGIYYMYYQGNGSVAEIGLATSPDGVHWEKFGSGPLIGLKDVAQNITAVAPSSIAVVNDVFYMIMHEADNAGGLTGYLFTSTDGIHWTQFQTSPVVTLGAPGTWNYGWFGDGSLRYLQGKFWYWYCATDTKSLDVWRMGLVTGTVGSAEQFWQQTGGPLATQDVRILASNSQGSLFAGTWTHGEVYKTTNNGDAWTVCGALPNPNPVLGLTIDRHDHLFASVFLQGIARSTNNGASWEMKNNGLTSFTTRWSVMDKQGNVWVATEGGLFRTTDDGESWTKMHSAMCYNVWLDSTGAIMTQEGDGTGFDNNGNSSNYVYRTTDAGTSWTTTHIIGKSFAGIHADGSYFASTYSLSTIYRSTDRGASWTDLHCPVSWDGFTAMMSFLPNGDVFFTKNGDGAGVIRTTNNGATWEVKNDGLTTLRVTYLYPHPDGYLFLATGFAGVFRSTQCYIPPSQDIAVTLPDVVTAEGSTVEIPVNVTNLSGHGIYSYEITVSFNTPDSILYCSAVPVTAGTLSGQPGWSVQLNTTVPNQVKIGAYGALPLAGQGELLKLKMMTLSGVQSGRNSALTITQILFNAGSPVPLVHNGSVTIHERVCGDADENGSVQAYDAALTLREALGPMSPPPAPLTSMGRLNADVNMDGRVQAYDAALILRHVVGLAMPESTATCFGGGTEGTPAALSLSAKINSAQYSAGQWLVQLQLGGVPAKMQVLSYSFELTAPAGWDDSTNLSLPQLAQGHLATVNRLGNGHFKVGIINPNGVDVANITLTLTAKYASSLNTITLSDLYLNDAPNAVITLSNVIMSIEPRGPAQPQSYDLIGAYPNPFNPSTRIAFVIPSSAQVHLEIYNTQGIRIRSLLHGQTGAGQHEVSWDGTNDFGQTVATGPYYCLMRAGSFVKTVRLMLLK